ncbi:hypothetical protein [Psychroserpens luteus]|uniref:PD-(D/E)XK nuclease superfamily protein n=1 Tax=Psychroserpens luteus TaxID=1434066 RepID=A0ABW5ZZK5_9FLAO|nr:hypothetical protein [Psychroserpens luteus]
MNYSKNLKEHLEKWFSKLRNSNLKLFHVELKLLLDNIESNQLAYSIIREAISKWSISSNELSRISDNLHYDFYQQKFENSENRAAFCYQLCHYLVKKNNYELNYNEDFGGNDYKETQNNVSKDLILPFIDYIISVLEESNSVLYLLEKYKKRTEWFTHEEIYTNYGILEKGYEDYLEDDLRKFLFDQGIEYPFSTPKSPSGRVDIVGNINTEDPLIIEIKIIDKSKGYGKNRIKSGLSQIIDYTDKFHKNQGFLVIFNFDNLEININLDDDNEFYPPNLVLNNKNYYFIIINMNLEIPASKRGKRKIMNLTIADLVD